MRAPRHPINWIQWLTLMLAVALAALTVFFVIQIRSTQQSSNQSLRSFICFFQSAVDKQPQTPTQKAKADRFFTQALELIHAKPCSTR